MTYDESRAVKFQRGAAEHQRPWNLENIDAITEMKQEYEDIGNYSELVEQISELKFYAQQMRLYAQIFWERLDNFQKERNNTLDKKE